MPEPVPLSSRDGKLTIRLQRRSGWLYVQRECRDVASRARLIQSIVFADLPVFLRWCDRDHIRFDDPGLASRVRQYGTALLEQP